MENLSHSLSKKSYSNNGLAAKSVYDDVSGVPPNFGVPTLSPRIEDYIEIFGDFHASRGSSIPILDLPVLDEPDISFDVRSPMFDYSEVFGGFDGLDFAVSCEELFGQYNVGDDSSEEYWNPAQSESLSDESDLSACSEKNQSFSNGDSHQSFDGTKKFNISYHKAHKEGMEDFSNGTMHITRLNAVPGFTFMVNEIPPSQTIEDEDPPLQVTHDLNPGIGVGGVSVERKRLRKTKSNPLNSVLGIQTYDNVLDTPAGYGEPASCPKETFLNVTDISLKTRPSHVPPPSRPPPALAAKNADSDRSNPKLRASKSYSFERMAGDSSPPFFDVGVDASSSASASAAAVKDAMEKAQAKLRSAKEFMEKKKEGVQSRTKLCSENDNKDKEWAREGNEYDSYKDERLQRICGSECSGMKPFAGGEGQKVTKTTQVVPGFIGREEHVNIAEKYAERKHGKDYRSSQVSHKTEGTVAWREATQFYEIVEIDKARKAFGQVKDEYNLVKNTKSHDLGQEKRVGWETVEHQEGDRKLGRASQAHECEENGNQSAVAKGACEWGENKGRPKATKEPDWQEHQDKVKVAQEVYELKDNKKKLRATPMHGETEKILSETDKCDEGQNLMENRRNKNETDVKQKLKAANGKIRKEKRLKDVHQRKENESAEETSLMEIYERRFKESVDEAEIEKRLKETVEHEEKEKQQLEAREKEKNEKKQEAREREESEKKEKEAREREENEKKEEAHEREESVKKQTEACERKENENKMKEPFEWEESEKSFKLDFKQEENEKGEKLACEGEENEKRLTEFYKKEKHEKQLKDALEQEANAMKHNEIHEREENERRSNHACEREEIEKRLTGAWEQEENKERLREALDTEEGETRSQLAFKEEGTEKRSNVSSDLEETENKISDAIRGEGLKKHNKDHKQTECEDERRLSSDQGIHLPLERKNFEAYDEPCKLSGIDTPQPPHVAGGLENSGHLNASQQVFSCEVDGKFRAECSDSNKELEAIVGANVLFEDIANSFGMNQNGLQHEGNQISVEDDSVTKSNEADTDIGHKRKESNKRDSQMASNHGSATILTHEQEEGSNNTKGIPFAFEREGSKDKFTSFQDVQEWVEKGRRMGDTVPVVLENKVSTKMPTRRVTSQSTARKERNFGKTFKPGEMEKEERLKNEKVLENDCLRKIEEEMERESEREREREKDRMAVDRVTREACKRAFAEARERAERVAVERATAEARQRALAEARERSEKASMEARIGQERVAAEARERAVEKAMAEKAAFEARERIDKSIADKFSSSSRTGGMRQSSSSSDLEDLQFQSMVSSRVLRYSYSSVHGGVEGDSPQRCKARLERHRRTAERAANALAEKNTRDLLAQREQAERNRLSETLDAEVKRWSSGKEMNLRALLSTLQYILGPDSGWQPIPLTEVITSVAVKKAYRKATLCVHPDKLQQRGASIHQKYICEKVFDLLKDAWNKFNSEER